MDGEYPGERGRTNGISPEEEVGQVITNKRRVGAYLYTDLPGPEPLRIPAQCIPGKRQNRYYQYQDDADDPVHLPGGFVGSAEEGPEHMHTDDDHQNVGRPEVDSPDQPPEVN